MKALIINCSPVRTGATAEIVKIIYDAISSRYDTKCTFVLLHHFQKKTQKTPAAEIEKAKRELEDYKRRYE